MWNGRVQRALIGLILGFVMGCGMSYIGLLAFNWLSQWIGREPVAINIWSVLPMGILLALAMAANMMNPPFGD